jgi:hypothetical protein
MDICTFISNIISAISWPLTLVLIFIVLRKEIRSLVPSLQRLKFRDFEMDFDKKVEELERRADEVNLKKASVSELVPRQSVTEIINDLITISPRLAVIESFTWLESAIRNAVIRHSISKDQFYGVRNGFRRLVEKGIIPEKFIPIFNELRTLRNELTHTLEEEIAAESARIYSEKAFAMTDLINRS